MTEVEIESLQIQAKELKGLPPPLPQKKKKKLSEARRMKEGFSPTGFRGNIILLMPLILNFWPSEGKANTFLFVCLFLLFRAVHVANGSSQARI